MGLGYTFLRKNKFIIHPNHFIILFTAYISPVTFIKVKFHNRFFIALKTFIIGLLWNAMLNALCFKIIHGLFRENVVFLNIHDFVLTAQLDLLTSLGEFAESVLWSLEHRLLHTASQRHFNPQPNAERFLHRCCHRKESDVWRQHEKTIFMVGNRHSNSSLK